jgi:hypothetical protein
MENFLNKCKLVHNNTYDYSLVNYINNKTKVTIICSEHGEFEQTPDKHINRQQGCPKCSKTYKINENDFIIKCNEIHNNRYDYSLVKYVNMNTNIMILCSEHGEFNQRASVHINGSNCPKCIGRDKDNDDIINQLKIIHNGKYDYSLVNYVNPINKITIICPEHGEFKQTLNTHKKGHGCPKCVGRDKNISDLIIKFNSIHDNKYEYSLITSTKSIDFIEITCPIHGNFKQNINTHLQGSGCPKCKGLTISTKKTKTSGEFILNANLIHDNKYNYSNVNYLNCKKHIKISCPEHGEFEQLPDTHLQGSGCPKCGLKYNKSEDEVKSFIKSLNIEIIENSKNIITPLELDIYIPSHNIAIEFDGLYWHNELFKPSNYHLNKTDQCESKGIQLIHIFEDEWLYKKDIVKSRLKNILGITENKIFGRKCIIKDVNTRDKKLFLDNNHIQGTVASSINLGLYYNDELVSLMTFGKGRIAMGGNSNQYELVRFCNKLNYNVIGGASKLLKYFIKVYQPKEIISYADRRWSQGNLYKQLEFTNTKTSAPNYWYIINNNRKHRFAYRKSILVKEGYDSNTTEHEIMKNRGIYRIYDCGTLVYKKTLSSLS